MDLYYAVGGGLGHLTRATAFFHSFNLNDKNFIIIVSSPHAEKVLKDKNYIIVPDGLVNDGIMLQQWLAQIVDKYDIKNIYLDTFLSGLYGEWDNFPASTKYKFFLVSRLLNWKKYVNKMVSPPHFEKIYIFENLDPEQQKFFETLSSEIRYETLIYPPASMPLDFSEYIKAVSNPIWLIVHSETRDELITLYNHARDVSCVEKAAPIFAIISPLEFKPIKEDTVLFNFYPAYPCFEKVHKIVTACGFNSMLQTKAFRHKHVFIPFERRFDNQYLRASYRKKGIDYLNQKTITLL